MAELKLAALHASAHGYNATITELSVIPLSILYQE